MVEVFISKCFFLNGIMYYYYLSAFCYNLSFQTRPERSTLVAPPLTNRKQKCKMPTVDKVWRARKRKSRACCCCFSSLFNFERIRQQPSAPCWVVQKTYIQQYKAIAYSREKFFFRSLFYCFFSLCCLFRCISPLPFQFHFSFRFVFLRSKNTVFHSSAVRFSLENERKKKHF